MFYWKISNLVCIEIEFLLHQPACLNFRIKDVVNSKVVCSEKGERDTTPVKIR